MTKGAAVAEPGASPLGVAAGVGPGFGVPLGDGVFLVSAPGVPVAFGVTLGVAVALGEGVGFFGVGVAAFLVEAGVFVASGVGDFFGRIIVFSAGRGVGCGVNTMGGGVFLDSAATAGVGFSVAAGIPAAAPPPPPEYTFTFTTWPRVIFGTG
jgi:hypothetical protein